MSPTMHLRIETRLGGKRSAKLRTLDSGGQLLAPFTARFSNDEWAIDLDLNVVDGQPSCVGYAVARNDDRPLDQFTTEVARGFNLRKLMSHAFARMALESEGQAKVPATTEEAVEAVVGPIRRRRAPITDQRLREVADAFRSRYVSGGAAEFASSLFVSERQMWRLVKLARQRGFLDGGDS